MRLAYFAGGPLIINEKGQIYGASYNDNLLSRYMEIGDELELCMRAKYSNDVSGLSKITLDNVFFTECVNLTPIKNYPRVIEAYKTVYEVINRCDGIIVRLPSTIGRIAVRCCRYMRRPYLVEMVGCPWDALWNHSWQGKILAAPIMLATKHEVKNAPAVIYVTKEFLQRRYPTNGVQTGCSDVEIQEVTEDVLARKKYRIRTCDDRKIILGTTAAVNVKYKGQQYLIEAIGNLKKRGINKFEYQLVGNGDQSYLRAVAKANGVENEIVFKGGMPHEEVFSWLDTIDIYVQPSKQDGLPRALVEAMSRGLPAIGANTGGIPELLDETCIVNKGRGFVDRIEETLITFDKKKMLLEAEKNFETAKHYRKEALEEERYRFYKEFFNNN